MLALFAAISMLIAEAEIKQVGPQFSPTEFKGWFDQAAESRSTVPPRVTKNVLMNRYVFVGGFFSEKMPGYFTANVKELRHLGVSREAIFHILPSSHESIEVNAGEVRRRFEEIAALGPERLVVIAHSRGACDTLAFALRNPDFVRDHIEALFLVQGPFGGTLLADYVAGEGPSLDHAMFLRDRAVLGMIGRVENFIQDRGKHGGLPEMTRTASRKFWAKELLEHADAVPIVGPRTFYVTTSSPPTDLRFVQRATGWYLHLENGCNDGVVALCDQSLPAIGTVVAQLNAGHSDLTRSRPSSREKQGYPAAMTDAIVMALHSHDVTSKPLIPIPTRRIQKRQRARLSESSR